MEEAIGTLITELKVKIIDTLNFEDITPDDIVEDHQLVGGELGIDSIDVLELVMMIDKDYGIKIDNKELGEKVFANLTSLARFIYENSSSVGN
ncbi:MAG: phosphopantetheine-binding protein [Candidatus Desulfacyla sp.]